MRPLRVVFMVVNNGMYGTIRLHQEKAYPGRPSGSELRNPDFAELARAPTVPVPSVWSAQTTSRRRRVGP